MKLFKKLKIGLLCGVMLLSGMTTTFASGITPTPYKPLPNWGGRYKTNNR